MKKISIKKYNLTTSLFYICYTLFILQNMLRSVLFLEGVLSIVSRIVILMIIPLCLFNIAKMKRKTAVLLLLAGLIIFISTFITGDNTLLIVFLTIVACKNINLERLMKYDVILKLIVMIIVIILYSLGMTAVNLHYRNGEIRQSMGFSNPNTFSSYVMSIVLELLFLRRKKIGVKEVLLSLIAIFVVDYFADSRTQIICIIASLSFIIMNNIWRRRFINNYFVKKAVINGFLIMLLISSILVNLYARFPSSMHEVNKLFSRRLEYSAMVIDEYGLTLVGNDKIYSNTVKQDGFPFDNGYVYLPYVYGIIPTMLIVFIMRKYMSYMLSHNNNEIALIMFVLLISGIMEMSFMRIPFNYFLLFFAPILYDNDVLEQNKKRKMVVHG